MTEEESFRNIAENVLSDILQKLPGLCPDQYVGQIKESEDWNEFTRKPVFNDEWEVINIPKDDKIMIMILESPHKDEFKGEIGPAKGPTGRNIRKHINDIFGKKYEDYHLILMNAIPFQCSLGIESSGSIRDTVFAEAWKNDIIGRTFFKVRLKKLLDSRNGKNVVVVNACTQGSKVNDYLCCKVCRSTINVLRACNAQSVNYYHIHHPSSKDFCNKDTAAIKCNQNHYPGMDKCKKCLISKKACYGNITYKS